MAVYSGDPKHVPGTYPQIRPDARELTKSPESFCTWFLASCSLRPEVFQNR